MLDENFHAQHYDTTLELYGRLIGMEAMLRALYTKLALEKDPPLSFIEEVLGGVSASLTKTGRADDEVEALLMRHAEIQIAETFAKVTEHLRRPLVTTPFPIEPVSEVPSDGRSRRRPAKPE
jgi:hypothetical protein